MSVDRYKVRACTSPTTRYIFLVYTSRLMMLGDWKWALSVLSLVVLGRLIQRGVEQIRLARIMPPGPPGLPLLGHIFLLSRLQWRQMMAWKDEYGQRYRSLSRVNPAESD